MNPCQYNPDTWECVRYRLWAAVPPPSKVVDSVQALVVIAVVFAVIAIIIISIHEFVSRWRWARRWKSGDFTTPNSVMSPGMWESYWRWFWHRKGTGPSEKAGANSVTKDAASP
jgi:hypothetical protein